MSQSWPGQVSARMGLTDEYAAWLAELDAVAVAEPAVLPDRAELPGMLSALRVTDIDAAEFLATVPEFDDPAVRWALDRCRALLVDRMGSFRRGVVWPQLPAGLGALGRFFYVAVFVAAVPDVRRYHDKLGIPEDISWASLGDLGQQMSVYRRISGAGGLHTQDWLKLPFTGMLYWLGRLQYNLFPARSDDGAPWTVGDTLIGTHIPETGPLEPEAAVESLRRAREFFPRYFPGRTGPYATCHSWLLDPQLAEYLPARSNIVRFARMFTALPGGSEGDRAVLEFVFRTLDADLDRLPQNTTLERAVVAHLRAGRHWRVTGGWLDLNDLP